MVGTAVVGHLVPLVCGDAARVEPRALSTSQRLRILRGLPPCRLIGSHALPSLSTQRHERAKVSDVSSTSPLWECIRFLTLDDEMSEATYGWEREWIVTLDDGMTVVGVFLPWPDAIHMNVMFGATVPVARWYERLRDHDLYDEDWAAGAAAVAYARHELWQLERAHRQLVLSWATRGGASLNEIARAHGLPSRQLAQHHFRPSKLRARLSMEDDLSMCPPSLRGTLASSRFLRGFDELYRSSSRQPVSYTVDLMFMQPSDRSWEGTARTWGPPSANPLPVVQDFIDLGAFLAARANRLAAVAGDLRDQA